MASLWGTITGADRKNASAEQLKRETARQAAEEAAARKAATEEAARKAAQKQVDSIQFKRGGAVVKKPVAAARRTTVKPVAKPKARR